MRHADQPDEYSTGHAGHAVLASADDRGFVSLLHRATPRAERYAIGRALRERVPRSALGDFAVPSDRADPIELIAKAHQGRLNWLMPVRIGRMASSPYAYLRGTADMMAEDFARLPSTGIVPIICGDAHLGNFGFYASPERELVFDLNDFDEAHPGAWEWDLRRLVTSVWVAGRQNGSSEADCASAVGRCVAAYRQHVDYLAQQPLLARSYERLDVGRLRHAAIAGRAPPGNHPGGTACTAPDERPGIAPIDRAHDGIRRIVEEPPLIVRPAQPRRTGSPGRSTPIWKRCRHMGAHARRLPPDRHRAQGRRRQFGRPARLPRPVRGKQPERCDIPATQTGSPLGGGAFRARRLGGARPSGGAGRQLSTGPADRQ